MQATSIATTFYISANSLQLQELKQMNYVLTRPFRPRPRFATLRSKNALTPNVINSQSKTSFNVTQATDVQLLHLDNTVDFKSATSVSTCSISRYA